MDPEIPLPKAALLDQMAAALCAVPDVVAIALGGSHARGTFGPDSDLDIGLYYREASPFAIADIAGIARRFSARGTPTVTEFYAWGPFVNGGAWIDNAVCRIDILYRNLDQLARVVRAAHHGSWEHNFDQQPPFGFRTITTLGEISCCKPLHDPGNVLAPLKAAVAKFPSPLRQRVVADMLWGADFSFGFARNFARAGDVPNTVACMTRIFHYLVQALYALNEVYFLNDKRVLQEIATFATRPADFAARISAVLGRPGNDADTLSKSIVVLREIFDETVALAGHGYRPKYTPP